MKIVRVAKPWAKPMCFVVFAVAMTKHISCSICVLELEDTTRQNVLN